MTTENSRADALTDAQILDVLKSVHPNAVRLPPGWLEFARAILAASPVEQPAATPIPMLLFCPRCGTQHIDAPETRPDDQDDRVPVTTWTNPPHRSHLCHACGIIWRPADVATVGIAAIETHGKADTWTASTPWIGHNRPAATSANETGAAGVRAWETDDGRVISDEQKQQALREGGASASSVRPFAIALSRIGTSPAMAAAAPADERAAILRDAIGLLRRVRLVHTGESRDPSRVEQAVKDFLAFHGDEPARAAASPAAAELPHWFEMFLTNVCEIPDRNSPEDEPDAIVATLDELRNCALNAIEQCVSYAAPQPAQADAPADDTHQFKSFHRQLCERFDYVHDEVDWRRDQVSLIEWIANEVGAPTEAHEPITCEAMLAAIDEFELVCDNNLARDLSPDEKFAVSEFVIDFFENAPTAMLSANREIWEYSYIHSSALGRGDEKIGPCLTYEKATAFGVGCIEQRLVACAPADAGEAVYAWVHLDSNYATANKAIADRHGPMVAVFTAPPAARVASLTDALRRAREELSIIEWENDPPARVTNLFSTIDALLGAHPGQREPHETKTNLLRASEPRA
ncbi:hypothetical protein [Burkholderia cepacia]|uniref:hypothetical protein n=1 Tax=Burkholderia cepacia TaxID=292 RepID=UPI000A713E2C|nr:hypothetical protein [Burkholderia cepacia]